MITGRAMKRAAIRLIRVWGTEGAIIRGEQRQTAPLVIQPIRSKNRLYQETAAAHAGWIDRGYAQLYVAEEKISLQEGDMIEASGERYMVLRAEKAQAQGETVYQRAVLAGAGKDGLEKEEG